MVQGGKSFKDFLIYIKSRKCIINGDSALKTWISKYKNLGINEILDVAYVGDSIGEGYMLTADTATLFAKASKWKMSNYFNSKPGLDDVGNGWLHFIYPSLSPLTTYAGTWATSNYSFINQSKTTIEANATVSFPFAGTGCEIWVQKAPSLGTIGVSVDGGDEVIMSLADATGFPVKMTIASGLVNTNHTVTITNKEAKRIHFSGYMEHKGTRGVRVHMCAKTGNVAGNFIDATKNLPWFTLLNPDLAIINIGTNDYMTNIVPSTFKTNLQTLVNHLKGLGTDIIIGTDGTNDRTGFNNPWQSFLDIIEDVALENNCCYINYDKLWGTNVNARNNGYLPAANLTDIHPTEYGQDSMFRLPMKVIDPF